MSNMADAATRSQGGWAFGVARSLNRTIMAMRARPMTTSFLVVGTVVGTLVYEAMVTHEGRVASPIVRNHLEYEIEPAKKEDDGTGLSTMKVTCGHLALREGHWAIRNTERNWSIMAQDMQKQKDSTAYRLERSKDDDFGRLTSGKL